MKIKIIIQLSFIIIIIFLSINISVGENISKEQTSGSIQISSGSKKILIPFPELNKISNKVNFVNINFCNNGYKEENLTNKLFMLARPEEKKEICLLILNGNDKDVNLALGFTDSAIYNGSYDCSTDYTRNNAFSKFMKPIENSIKVPANGHVILKTTIKFPIGVKGMQNGCFAYSVKGEEISGPLTFVTRKRAIINILVRGNPYTKIEKLRDIIIKNKNIVFDILFIIILILLILEIKKYKK